jgi:glycosyltransferase involved in cell wall biosynthesis
MSRVAIVHDYFVQTGGAERVAEALYSIYPDATVFATVALPDHMPAQLGAAEVRTTWMQRLPRMRRYYRHYFLLYPWAVESLDLDGYELILSSSSGYAKGLKRPAGSVHVCYCHTPMRWAWRSDEYTKRERHGRMSRLLIGASLFSLRRWDLRAANRPDYYIANSRAVADRIQNTYKRHAEVIPPPIDVNRFQPSPAGPDDYYLVLSRLIAYKRIDLAVAACTRLNRRLIVVGEGPEYKHLREIAGPTIEFVGRQPDAAVNEYAARCQALLFTGEEDFGMAPLEVNAAGRPVIAYRAGGALETVAEGVSGMFFNLPHVDSLANAIVRFEKAQWNSSAIRAHACAFDRSVFDGRIRHFVENVSSIPVRQGAA